MTAGRYARAREKGLTLDDEIRPFEMAEVLDRVVCMDALRGLVMMPSGSCQMLLTDPPYSSGGLTRSERRARTSKKYQQSSAIAKFGDFEGDARDERSYVRWCAMWLAECYRVLEQGSSAVVFCDWRQLANTADAVQMGGFVFRGIVPWVKTAARPQPNSFRCDCEYAVWATKGDIDRRPLPGAKYIPGHWIGAPSGLARGCTSPRSRSD